MRPQSRSLPELRPWVMRIKLPLHHLEEVACELNLALTQADALDDTNKVAASPTWVDGLRAQSYFLPRLRPWVMRIEC